MKTEAAPYTLADYIGIIRRRWKYVVIIFPSVVMVAIYLAFTLPPLYRSAGTILLESSSIPEDMVRTTVTTFASQQLELTWRRVFTIDNLVDLVQEVDPYPDEPELSDGQKARLIIDSTTTQRVDPVTLQPLEISEAFTVSYLNPDPDIARTIASRLVDMFLEYSVQSRIEVAQNNVSFLEQRALESNERVLQFEAAIADFKEDHGQALPETIARNLNSLDRAERDLEATERQILTAREQQSMLELQVSQINPYLFDPDGDWRSELASLRAELAAARQRYTEAHPDVRRLRQAIQALSARSEEEQPSAFTVPDNPEYLRLQSQLSTVEQELAGLTAAAAANERQIETYGQRIQIAPEVEREYSQLLRDYELAQDRLRGLEGDITEASLASVLETDQLGLRYTMIRSPGTPSSPDSPNRPGIILLGMILGGSLAAILAALHESSDPSIRSSRDLAQITDIRPLGAIPVLTNQTDRRLTVVKWLTGLTIFAAATSYLASAIS